MARDKKLNKQELARLVDLAVWIDWALWSDSPAIGEQPAPFWGALMLWLSDALREARRRGGYVGPLAERSARAALAAKVDTSGMGEDERAWTVEKAKSIMRWANFEPVWWAWLEH